MEALTTLDQVRSAIREVLKVGDHPLTPETRASDVKGWDSVAHIQIILKVEKKFGVKLRPGEILKLKNLNDFVNLVDSKLAASSR